MSEESSHESSEVQSSQDVTGYLSIETQSPQDMAGETQSPQDVTGETQSPQDMTGETQSSQDMTGYLSIKETAFILGVSERSVYGYIESGKLPGARVDNLIVAVADAVYRFKRRAPGRVRTISPRWRVPPLNNDQYLTFITARVRPGQDENLEPRLLEMRAQNKHRLPGTSARYIARDREDPEEVTIVLVWRSSFMPPEEERQSSLAAFYADFADILDWDTAEVTEGQVLLHA